MPSNFSAKLVFNQSRSHVHANENKTGLGLNCFTRKACSLTKRGSENERMILIDFGHFFITVTIVTVRSVVEV